MSELFFAGPHGSLPRFPREHELHERCGGARTGAAVCLPEFIEDVLDARDHVWVFDLHFDDIGVAALAEGLRGSTVREVRILTGGSARSSLEERLAALRQIRTDWGFDPGLEAVFWCARLDKSGFPYPHDRFAIVDQHLWHFGHTVGGAGRALFAVSGKWDAEQTGALDFFPLVWDRFVENRERILRDRA